MKVFFLILVVLVVAALAIAVPSRANADPRYVDVVVSADAEGNVTIGELPAGAQLVNVHVWNDCRGGKMRALGLTRSFQLKPCESFNFLWKDSEGTWYQMITPRSRVGGSLVVDDTYIGPDGQPQCKYLYPAAGAGGQ